MMEVQADAAADAVPPAEWLLRERTLTSLEDAYRSLDQRPDTSEPLAVYLHQSQKLQAALARVCLAQLSDSRVRFCFYYPQERQAAAFLKAVQVNPGLHELNLKDNGFLSAVKLKSLGRLLENHWAIARLNLSENQFAPGAYRVLHNYLSLGTSLVALKLSRCNLTDSDGELLGTLLARDKQLERLSLSGNALGARTAAALAVALGRNNYLVDLDLSWNTFSWANFATIAEGLTANSELRRLSCSSNGVEDKGLAALLEAAAAETSQLRVLELDNCRVTHLSTEALLQFLRRRPQMHAMKLNRNLFREADLLRLLGAVTAEPQSQLALLEMNNLPRTPTLTQATPAGLRLTLATDRQIKVKTVNADRLGTTER